MFWKYAANLQENTHAEGLFQVASNFIGITLRHVCSPVNLLHIFRARCSALGGCFCCELTKKVTKATIPHKISESSCVLALFSFTTNEMELNCYHQKLNVRVASRVAERLTKGLRKKQNLRKFQNSTQA